MSSRCLPFQMMQSQGKGELLKRREKLEMDIDHTNKEYIEDEPFQDIRDLPAKLEKLKYAFMKHDPTSRGEIDYVSLHVLARGLGVFRTLAEWKKWVQEITGNSTNVISYKDCAMTMLGRRSTMCQRIMKCNENGTVFEKKPCLLDNVAPTYISYLEFAVSPSISSPITIFPPPPPPSPADMGAGGAKETYPAA